MKVRKSKKTMRFSEKQFQVTMRRLSSWLASLARKRSNGVVTADDVHRYLDSTGVSRKQVGVRLKFINSVLREPYFYSYGKTPSERPAAKGRVISTWKRN